MNDFSSPSGDGFADLFGPGTVPVGGARPSVQSVPADAGPHPFDAVFASRRNPADPLAELKAPPPTATVVVDPLALFTPGETLGAVDIFADRSPSTLRAPTRVTAVEDVRPVADHAPQIGGFMHAPQVQKKPD